MSDMQTRPYLKVRVTRLVMNPRFNNPTAACARCGHIYLDHFTVEGRNTGCTCGCKRWRAPEGKLCEE